MNIARLVEKLSNTSLWLIAVAVSVILTQGIVVFMSLLLKGTIDPDFIITGVVASLLVASLVMSLIMPFLKTLRTSEHRYHYMFAESPQPMWVFEENSLCFLDVNQSAIEHYGYSHEEFMGLTLQDIRPPEDHALLQQAVRNLPPGDSYGEYRHRKKNGAVVDVAIWTRPFNLGGRKARLALVNNITGRKQAEDKLHLTATVFESTLEGILITDADNNIVEVNGAFTRITGYSREDVLGVNPRILKSGHQGSEFYELMWDVLKTTGHWVGEIWNRRKDGEVYPQALTISSVVNGKGEVTNYVGIFSDITMLKQHEKQLEHTAHFDALTGIPNRVLLADRMKQALAHARRNKTLLAVCYLDLDGFKPINDTMGHEAGDKILIEIARRIERTIRGDDTVARLGGDEFVILLMGMEQPEECVMSLNRLLEVISQPIQVGGKSFELSASIGVTLYPVDEEDADTLLRHADQAMYSAKQAGKNRYHLYDPEHDQRTRIHQAILAQIVHGLAHNQFELYYQPKVNMASRQLVGAEALIRWRHPERGLLLPGEFLRAIEGTELENRIGEWVIATALEQLKQWRQAGLELELSINISAFHLQSPDFVEKLRWQLSGHPELPAGRLQIEILETAALEDVAKVTAIIEACRAIGVGFALDDFGTGYSSLSYLSSLPVDTLKIDQSFVRDMLDDKGDHAIVQGIIALARAFERETVAEGVETEELYQALLEMGCELGQGYGIARPMPAGELLDWRMDADSEGRA